MAKTVGIVGLGRMGSAMAKNLIEAGFGVVGRDTDPARADAALRARAEQRALRQHHRHPTRVRRQRRHHLLNPGVVAVASRRVFIYRVPAGNPRVGVKVLVRRADKAGA